ncbi:MFS transporter [Streptomyces sp. NPDC051940]|uniref:MFS transporter n=1 Tax=Streptomyces sp. NPDC051940 TaxID=3155675 RepID=UPI00341D26B3
MATGVSPAGAGLRWRGGFGWVWGAAVVSRFGDALRGVALPLLAVRVTDSAFLVSVVAAAQFLPWIVFGLVGGAVADRVDQRRVMAGVDALRAVVMGVFAVVVWAGEVRVWMLVGVAFVLSALQTLFDNAATALLPAVVPREALGRANGRLMTGQEIAYRFVGGPLVPVALGASLALPYAVDAVSFALAAAMVATLRVRPTGKRPAAQALRHDIADGLRALWADRVLRTLAGATVVCNTAVGAVIGVLVLHITGWLGAGPTGYAVVLTAYGAGTVAAGPLAGRFADRFGQARVLVWATAAEAVALVVFGTVRSLPVAAGALAVFGFAGMLTMVIEVTVLQQRSPAAMTGRISAAFRTATVAGTPLGALLGGALAELLALNAPVLAAAALLACGAVMLVPTLTARMN